MKFYDESSESYAFAGTWCLSEEELTYISDDVFSIELDEYEEGLYEVNYIDWNDHKNSWFARVSIEFNGSIRVFDADTGEMMGWVWVNGDTSNESQDEQLLLGVYDVIEAWFNDLKIFGVTC
jgi:hypothetical protein